MATEWYGGDASENAKRNAELELRWEAFNKVVLEKCKMSWFSMLARMLMLLPESDAVDEVKLPKPEPDVLETLNRCLVPWYKTFWS